MFAGRLPSPEFGISDAQRAVGMCTFKKRTHPDGRIEHYDFKISISRRFTLTDAQIEDVIIHEMIHYFIAYNGLVDSAVHGTLFMLLMNNINTQYSRNVTVRHEDPATVDHSPQPKRRAWVVVAALTLPDGNMAVKVLPRTIPTIRKYYDAVRSSAQIRDIRLYLHDNPFWGGYPKSGALKYHHIDKEVLTRQLSGARPLRFDGSRLLES